MNVLVSGSTGFIGSALVKFLSEQEISATRLVRRRVDAPEKQILWDPSTGAGDIQGLEGLDGVIHLAGENIMGRWTTQKKVQILESRVRGTTLLCEALTRLKHKPRVLISASAIGCYGDRGEESLSEESAPGSGFLSEVCQAWERATDLAKKAGLRVVNIRVGVVLSPKGGALKKILPPFRWGVGGRLGSGRQYMSWISLGDLLRVFHHALLKTDLFGPVNGVGLNPVTNLEFTRTLGRVLGRPVYFTVPRFFARMMMGRAADEILFASVRVEPKKLLGSGFRFNDEDLRTTLKRLLIERGRP